MIEVREFEPLEGLHEPHVEPPVWRVARLLARELNATELTIITGANGRTYELSQERLDVLYAKVFATIQQNYDSTIVDNLLLMASDISNLAKEDVCEITRVFYSEVLIMPPEEAADLLRDMFSP